MTSTHPTLADLDALTAEEPFVRALARALCRGDQAAADDVVQQTFVEVLRRGAPDGDARRGFLARVVRSRVLNLRRGEARRTARERAAARGEAVLGPDELLQRAELRRRVVDAVRALPEPYRTAVLLRYLEGRTPRAIAAQLGVPRDTVATRLKRGLALLRARFDADHGGDRGAWVTALAPLALPAREAGAGGVLVARLFGLGAAIQAMKHILILLGAAVALALFASRSGRSVPDATPGAGPGAAASTAAGAPLDGDDGVAVPDRVAVVAPAGAPESAGPRPPAPELPETAAVVGRAVGPDGAPAAGRACRLFAFDPLTGFGSVREPSGDAATAGPRWLDTQADEFGRFAFEDVPPGGLHALWLAHDGPHATWLPMPSTPGPGERMDLGTVVLEVRGALTGTVVDANGAPVAGAEVWALDLPGAVLGLAPFERIEAGGALLVALPGFESAGTAAADAQAAAEAVRDHLRAWVLQAPAHAQFQVLPFPAWMGRLLEVLPRPRTRSGADGRFELFGLTPGDNLLVARGEGLAFGGRPRVPVRAGERREVGTLRLPRGEPTTARVLDADGTPVAGAEVRVALRPPLGLTGILFASAPRRAGADGLVDLGDLPRGEYLVAFRRAEGDGWATFGPLGAGENLDLRLPAEHAVRLAVAAAGAEALAGVEVEVRAGPPFGEATAAGWQPALAAGRHVAALPTGDEGLRRFELRGLGARLHTVRVRAPGCVPAVLAVDPSRVEADEEIAVRLRPGVTCEVEVVDAAGRPVRGAEVLLAPDGEPSPLAVSLLVGYGGVRGFRALPRAAGRTGADGRLRIDGVAPGPVVAVVRHPARGVAVARGDGTAALRAVLADPGAIHGRLTDGGLPPAPAAVELVARLVDSGEVLPQIERRARPAADGTFRFVGLTPGRWAVQVKQRGAAPPGSLGGLVAAMSPSIGWWAPAEITRVVEVPAGGEVELALDADPLAPPGGEPGVALRVAVLLDGQPVAGVPVVATVPLEGLRARDFVIAETDAAGRAARDRVRAAPFELSVEFDGLSWTRELQAAPGTDLDAAFDSATGLVEVRVIGYDGLPGVGHEVAASGAPSAGGTARAWAMTGDDGTARLRLPVGDAYTLRVDGVGGALQVPSFAVAAGSSVREVRLGTAGVLAGRVTAGQGPAIERIVVLAADRSWFASARLGDGGAFALTGVAPGTYDLRLGAGSAEFDAVPARVDIGPDGRVGVVLGVGRPCEDR